MRLDFDWANVQQYLIIVGAFAATFVILFALKKVVSRRLVKWVRAGRPEWYEHFVREIQGPLNLIFAAAAIGVALQVAPPALREHPAAKTGSRILLIVALFWLVDKAAQVCVRRAPFTAKLTPPTKSLLQTAAHAALLVLSILIVLDTMGISITPLLASLGVGSVAVALALQDTLSNFFSGIYVLVDKPIRIGDVVGLEDQTIGTVRRIGWRSSHIEIGSGNMVVIPNIKLANSVVTNYDLPSSEVNFTLSLGVSYDANLEVVEKTTLEIARSVVRGAKGAVPTAEPSLLFTTFGDSSIGFNLVARARSLGDTGPLKHEMIKRLHEGYRAAGIEIPYPQRTLRFVQGEQSRAAIDARI